MFDEGIWASRLSADGSIRCAHEACYAVSALRVTILSQDETARIDRASRREGFPLALLAGLRRIRTRRLVGAVLLLSF